MEQLQVIEDEVAAALAIPLAKPILVMKGMSTLAVAGDCPGCGAAIIDNSIILGRIGLTLSHGEFCRYLGRKTY